MAETEKQKRVIVITGGSSGIGKAMAETFAGRGEQVVIIGRHEDSLRAAAQAIGSNCTWQRADISQRDQVEKAVNAIVAQFKQIDVLINNAGESGFARGLSQNTPLAQAEEIWNDIIGVNLTGTFLMTFAAGLYLARPGGRIIAISSDAAATGAVGLRLAGYVAAKSGMEGLMRSLALEYGPQGITVNTIQVGFVPGTSMNGKIPDEIIKSTAAQLPVRRPGNGNDIAAAAVFLASPEAGFITGELLNVNGGRVFGR